MDPQSDASTREALTDVARRMPAYVQLSHRLVAEGRISARQQGQFLGGLGYGSAPLAILPRFIPGLAQVTHLLRMFGAIRYALDQMQDDVVDEHLAAAGLTREQLEADLRVTSGLTRRAGQAGAKNASQLMEDGARVTGRLAGKGVRAFRKWQASTSTPRVAPKSRPALESQSQGGDDE